MSVRERFSASQLASLTEVEPAAWNALTANQPLLSHEFLLAMESSGSVGPGTHWQPCHLVLRDSAGELAGALPLYLKTGRLWPLVLAHVWIDMASGALTLAPPAG